MRVHDSPADRRVLGRHRCVAASAAADAAPADLRLHGVDARPGVAPVSRPPSLRRPAGRHGGVPDAGLDARLLRPLRLRRECAQLRGHGRRRPTAGVLEERAQRLGRSEGSRQDRPAVVRRRWPRVHSWRTPSSTRPAATSRRARCSSTCPASCGGRSTVTIELHPKWSTRGDGSRTGSEASAPHLPRRRLRRPLRQPDPHGEPRGAADLRHQGCAPPLRRLRARRVRPPDSSWTTCGRSSKRARRSSGTSPTSTTRSSASDPAAAASSTPTRPPCRSQASEPIARAGFGRWRSSPTSTSITTT